MRSAAATKLLEQEQTEITESLSLFPPLAPVQLFFRRTLALFLLLRDLPCCPLTDRLIVRSLIRRKIDYTGFAIPGISIEKPLSEFAVQLFIALAASAAGVDPLRRPDLTRKGLPACGIYSDAEGHDLCASGFQLLYSR